MTISALSTTQQWQSPKRPELQNKASSTSDFNSADILNPVKLEEGVPSWDEYQAKFPTEQEQMQMMERQMADPVHTVFRVGDQVVATIGTDVGYTFSSNAAGGNTQKYMAEATKLGLTGEDRRMFMSEKLEADLKRQYPGLQVDRYPNGSGPAAGYLRNDMFGTDSWSVDALGAGASALQQKYGDGLPDEFRQTRTNNSEVSPASHANRSEMLQILQTSSHHFDRDALTG